MSEYLAIFLHHNTQQFCQMAIKTTNPKENLQRHYILKMKDLL